MDAKVQRDTPNGAEYVVAKRGGTRKTSYVMRVTGVAKCPKLLKRFRLTVIITGLGVLALPICFI